MEVQLDVRRKTNLLAGARREAIEKPTSLQRHPRLGEDIIRVLLLICGGFSIVTTLGILVVLVGESRLLFSNPDFSLVEFVTGTAWQPQA
ncbi:MAG: phosphate ABC transporter permease subunit PstC, partial [Anaerolineae bacterium]|nr:phosphate ABC transporter permease subunit PstC [Anaerolineae bacterium]